MGIEVAIGLAVAGAAVGAAGAIQAGNAAESAGRWNAALAKMQAEEDERISRRESSALLGRQRAVTASQGTTIEGSPMMILEDTAAEAEIEALHIRKGGQARATAFMKQGKAAKTAAMFEAGSTLLGGAGRAVGMTV